MPESLTEMEQQAPLVKVYSNLIVAATENGFVEDVGWNVDTDGSIETLASLLFILKHGRLVDVIIKNIEVKSKEAGRQEDFNRFMSKWNELKNKFLINKDRPSSDNDEDSNKPVIQPLFVDM